ncbi:MAG: hypothetical protein AMXMBFR74_12500 [Parvibaculum sp.]|nr:hypothetical protein [Parvibaculum sp.]
MKIPNKATEKAIRELELGKGTKFASVGALFRDAGIRAGSVSAPAPNGLR